MTARRATLAGLLAAVLLAGCSGTSEPPAAGQPASPVPAAASEPAPTVREQGSYEDAEPRLRPVALDGVRVRMRPGTRQVVTVNHTGGHTARVVYWERDGRRWERRMTARDGRIGYGGLVLPGRREQGTGTTPLGTFGIPFAFGRHRDRPAWQLSYRRIRQGDFWVQDNGSRFYNRYRNQRQGGFRWWLPPGAENSSERLLDFGSQYEWALVMDFNWDQVRRRGSGIFLHVNGDGATAGCVSAPRPFVRRLMADLEQDAVPVVAVGR